MHPRMFSSVVLLLPEGPTMKMKSLNGQIHPARRVHRGGAQRVILLHTSKLNHVHGMLSSSYRPWSITLRLSLSGRSLAEGARRPDER